MIKAPEKLVKETKAIIRVYFFLRYECGLREADRLGARELRVLLRCLKTRTRQEKG